MPYNDSIKESRGFRIHVGNTISDSSGCVLVGTADRLLTGSEYIRITSIQCF